MKPHFLYCGTTVSMFTEVRPMHNRRTGADGFERGGDAAAAGRR